MRFSLAAFVVLSLVQLATASASVVDFSEVLGSYKITRISCRIDGKVVPTPAAAEVVISRFDADTMRVEHRGADGGLSVSDAVFSEEKFIKGEVDFIEHLAFQWGIERFADAPSDFGFLELRLVEGHWVFSRNYRRAGGGRPTSAFCVEVLERV